MVWVIVFVGIGLAGLIMLICYAVWLAHKASDLFSELDMLATRADELAELVRQINLPEPAFQPDWRSNGTITS
ncbi:MAG TPA: hypothetical protein VJN19_14020 [Propionibacteriaceae bacterium]|nr:hypothetical protein [Propionibacteriaceae bacterium]